MKLLTDRVYWVAGALAAIALAGGAWLTSLTGPGWPGLLVNLLVLLVAVCLALVAVGLVLNRLNAFYERTSDLFPARRAPAVRIVGADPGRRQQLVTIPSSVGNRDWQVTIILPEGYSDPEHAEDVYPVLVAAHGYPGTMAQWHEVLDIRELGDPVVAEGSIRPFITVIPRISPTGEDTECVHGPDAPTQMEQWLMCDVPEWVTANLRAAPERDAWAWLGFSEGGWCAAMAAMLHPERFAAAIVLTGYFRPWWDGVPPADLDEAALQRLDLVALAGTAPPPVSMWVQSSKGDRIYHDFTSEFLDAVSPPLSVTAVTDEFGGHARGTWRPHVAPALRWLGANVAGFRP